MDNDLLVVARWTKKLFKDVKAGSHQNLILDDIRKIRIPIPMHKEKKQITSVFFEMEDEIEMLKKKLDKYKLLKQGLMQNLLTGKIRLV